MTDPARLPLSQYDRPSVAVDIAVLTVMDGGLRVLLVRRAQEPAAGLWALPGGLVHVDRSIEQTVEHVLDEKARLPGLFVEQLFTFGDLGRDPRGRVITIAHFALSPSAALGAALAASLDGSPDRVLATVALQADGLAVARDHEGRVLPLAFDHACIIGLTIERLRGKLDYSDIALALLPPLFTLRQLQDVHEAILGLSLNKPAFRRKMLDRGLIAPSGQRETNTRYRPAELFRRARALP